MFNDDSDIPPDVVPGSGLTREDLERQSDAFGLGHGRVVFRPGRVVEDADGNPIGMTPGEDISSASAGTIITPAQCKKLGLTREWLEAHPGIYVIGCWPPPGQRWSFETRKLEEIPTKQGDSQ